jgi:hypothetical protein
MQSPQLIFSLIRIAGTSGHHSRRARLVSFGMKVKSYTILIYTTHSLQSPIYEEHQVLELKIAGKSKRSGSS